MLASRPFRWDGVRTTEYFRLVYLADEFTLKMAFDEIGRFVQSNQPKLHNFQGEEDTAVSVV